MRKIFSGITPKIILLTILVFVIQRIVLSSPVRTVLMSTETNYYLVPDIFTFLFSIHGIGMSCWFFWTPLTYMFLHGTIMHLLLNMVCLHVFGTEVERQEGRKVFSIAYFGGGIVGGVAWCLLSGLNSIQPCVGASAGVLSLVGLYMVLHPKDKLVVFLPMPVNVPMWLFASLVICINVVDMFFIQTNTASFAHLVGIAMGISIGVYLRTIFKRNGDTI